MTKFIIFRHGQTDWNVERRSMGTTDIPLNDHGKEQADKLATRLKNEHINVFYSSPLGRALETTRIVAKSHGKEVIVHDDLIEMHLGIFEGKTKAERLALFPEFDVANDMHREKMDMDVFDAAIKKLKKYFIPHLLENHDNQTIVLGTHDQKMRALLVALGMPTTVKSDILKNCAVSIIEITDGKIHVICHNDNSHIDENIGNISHQDMKE